MSKLKPRPTVRSVLGREPARDGPRPAEVMLEERILPEHLAGTGALSFKAVSTLMTGAAVLMANSCTDRMSMLRSLRLTDYRMPVEAGRPLRLVARTVRTQPGGMTIRGEALAESVPTGEHVTVALVGFDITTYPARPYEEHHA